MLSWTPGSWLYRRATLSWLSDAALARQLPRPYRFFARCCPVLGNIPLGAELLLRAIIALEQRTSREDGIVPLRIGEVTAFLDLRDPRFLQVPRELAKFPRVLAQFLRPGDTFIDVGANHGAYSISAARLIGPE